jgi:hypothetical protein
MSWNSATIYFVEFIRSGTILHRQGYHQMSNMEQARRNWTGKNTKPPATGIARDEYETSTYPVYVTDLEIR